MTCQSNELGELLALYFEFILQLSNLGGSCCPLNIPTVLLFSEVSPPLQLSLLVG
jgi:hypothetical protein